MFTVKLTGQLPLPWPIMPLAANMLCEINEQQIKPGIERVQALADISRSALCCHRLIATKPMHRLHSRPIVLN